MGAVFLTIPVPQKPGLVKYRISLKVIAASYFIMSILVFLILIFQLPDNASEHFTFIAISISSFQAYLFTFALITLLDPKYITLKSLFYHLLPFLIIGILFIFSSRYFGNPVITRFSDITLYLNNPTLWIRLIFYIYYVYQLIFYTLLFLQEEKVNKQRMMNYYSDDVWLKLSWVRIAFFSALTVGIIAMLSYLFPQNHDWIFTFIFSFFYFAFAIEYVRYNKIYTIIEPVLTEEKKEEVEPSHISSHARIKQEWEPLKNKIIRQNYYLEVGINIEIIAHRLGIGRTVLSTLINREEGMNFNTWINSLRVNKAKEIILQYPDESLSIIAEKVGYTEHANFSRQFKNITGETPLIWKKKHMELVS